LLSGDKDKKNFYVRNIVKSLLSEVASVKYEYTSLNLLAHFIKEVVGDPSKPDSNPAFKDAYTDLTSSTEDREIFTEFILDFANEDFRTIDADREPKSLGQDFVERGFEEPEEDIEDVEEDEEDEVITISVNDLEDSGGDIVPEEPEEEEFTIGEDLVEEEPEEDVNSGIKKYSREAYKRIGPALRRYYGQIQKESVLKNAVEIDGKEYPPGDVSERELFRIYLKKNLLLWASRYEELFFQDSPETDIEIDGQADEEEAVIDADTAGESEVLDLGF